jgi:hypothetical protein
MTRDVNPETRSHAFAKVMMSSIAKHGITNIERVT